MKKQQKTNNSDTPLNFYEILQKVLFCENKAEKINDFKKFYILYKDGRISFENVTEPMKLVYPSYKDICHIVPPQKVPKRGAYDTKEGLAKLIHAVCHIEYSAIDLALDAAYRFRGMPDKFYDDWVAVANDEIRHFLMLELILNELGYEYGDFDVHNALFEAMQRTNTLLERMAIVPRYLEANGLDATPAILKKLKNYQNNEMVQKSIKALDIILSEEIDHVKKGDYWFEWACKKEEVSKDVYFKIVSKYYPNALAKERYINVKARLKAGFCCKELETISKKKIC